VDVDVDLPDARPGPARLLRLVAAAIGAGDRLGDLRAVAMHLVDNAYRHARGPRRLRLRRLHDRGLVRVEVDDGSPSRLPVLGRFDTPAHGRGLLVVNRLAVNWGHRPHYDHKTVWSEIRLA
jgi:hypothetical protein